MSKGWPTVALGEVLQLENDAVTVDPAASYRMAGVYSFGRGLFPREPLSGTETTYKCFHRLHRDTLVLSQLKGWEGAIARIGEHFDGWFLSPQFQTFRPIAGRLEIGFVDWYCKRSSLWALLAKGSRGMGARRDSVSPKQFLTTPIPLPPLGEQRRIVAKVEALAAKIKEARGLRANGIDQLRFAIPSETTRIFAALTDYPQTPLGDLGMDGLNPIQTGPFGAQLHKSEFVDGGIPVLNVGNVDPDGLILSPLDHVLPEKAVQLSRYSLRPDDLLFARSGATLGKVCLVPPQCDGWLMTGHLFRVRLDTTRCLPPFAFVALRGAQSVCDQVFSQVRGATRPGFNTTLLSNVRLPVPPVAEQRRIVAYLDALQAEVDGVKAVQAATQAELEALLPAILDRAFKGQL